MGASGLRNAAAAARVLVRSKRADDRVAVVSFGRRAFKLSDFTSSAADVDSVLSGLAIDDRSGTALYDAIVESAADAALEPLAPAASSSCSPTARTSRATRRSSEAVAAARKSGAAVYAIGIESPDFRAGALRSIASETNGTLLRGRLHAVARAGVQLDRSRARPDLAAQLRHDRPARRPAALARHAARLRHRRHDGEGSGGVRDVGPRAGIRAASEDLLLAARHVPHRRMVGLLALAALLLFVQLGRGSWVKQRIAAHLGDASATRPQQRRRVVPRSAVPRHRRRARTAPAVADDREDARSR